MALDFIARAAAAAARSDAAQALARSATLDLFTDLPSKSFDSGVTAVVTAGYAATGSGAANYVADQLATAALAANHPRFCKQTANGRYFRLVGDSITVEQAGALGDGGNDQPAVQAAIDYAIAVGIRKVRFTKPAYTLWTPVRAGGFYSGSGGVVLNLEGGSIELEGIGTKTTLTQKGHTGGPIATDTVTTTDAQTWRGYMIWVGNVPTLTLRNLILDGTVDYNIASGNSGADISHKGLCCVADGCTNMYVYNCEMKRFKGEVFFLGATKPDYVYVENLKLSDSPQSLWNAGTLAQVVAINLDCYNSYQALEVTGGRGHTYIGGRFSLSATGSVIGTQSFVYGYPYWFPNRDTSKIPPWITFLGTRFEYFNSLPISSWVRGNIVTVDTTVVLGNSCDRDIDLKIEAWCDGGNGSQALQMNGPSTLTDAVPGAPAGTYYTPPQGVHIEVNVRRTAAAIAANRRMEGIRFSGGLLDAYSCTFAVRGDVSSAWKVLSPVSGFILPPVRCEGITSNYIYMGGQSLAATAGSTTSLQVAAPAYSLSLSGAGVGTINLGNTFGYVDGQRVILMHSDGTAGRTFKLPAGGAGLGLKEDRILYKQGDLIELEFTYWTQRWQEVRYESSQQQVFTGSATYDAPSIAAGGTTSTTVTVTGASLGDFVDRVSLGVSAGGLVVTGHVSAANTVTVVLYNPTGAAIDLASTTLSVEVKRK